MPHGRSLHPGERSGIVGPVKRTPSLARELPPSSPRRLRVRVGLWTAAVILLTLPGCSRGSAGAADLPRYTGAALRLVADGLDAPVWLASPTGDQRLFVVEQRGRIRIIRDGHLEPGAFLDLTDRVGFGGERGLLSVAFHPRYRDNGLLFVDYTDKHGDTRIERFRVSRDPDRADPGSATLVLTIAQPHANHNGGLVVFGPDSMLWIGMGDGGSQGDPENRAQDTNTLLGKLLRIDIDHGDPYAIPRDNPFADGRGGRREIWARGLRNPWRFSFDPPTRRLWIGDVGQNRWEEVDAVPIETPGLDFGWSHWEGSHPYRGAGAGGSVSPVAEYGHSDGCSVTGGFVYRGRELPDLVGCYVFADYCRGWIRSLELTGDRVSGTREWQIPHPGAINSFGVDSHGELYVLCMNGKVWRVVKAPR